MSPMKGWITNASAHYARSRIASGSVGPKEEAVVLKARWMVIYDKGHGGDVDARARCWLRGGRRKRGCRTGQLDGELSPDDIQFTMRNDKGGSAPDKEEEMEGVVDH